MKVILRQDLDNLGSIGDVVEVKNGYGRNYLIPRQYAYYASPAAIQRIKFERKQYDKRQEEQKAVAESLAAKLAELQVSIPMKVGEEGKLFGAVTGQAIAEQMSLMGHNIDRRDIIIDEP
ncbi:MAG: 50S ribosomal protein L9, partial [Candidatus Kapaibacterium sp.]